MSIIFRSTIEEVIHSVRLFGITTEIKYNFSLGHLKFFNDTIIACASKYYTSFALCPWNMLDHGFRLLRLFDNDSNETINEMK